MAFNFQREEEEPDEMPEGEYTYLFQNFGTDEMLEVEADNVTNAWYGVRFHDGEDWYEWHCLGRKDIVEYKKELEQNDSLSDSKCSITGDHPVHFAARNPGTVRAWKANDEDSE